MVTSNSVTRHNITKYILGFNSKNLIVTVESSKTGLRKLFVNGEEIVRQKSTGGVWVFSHFIASDQTSNANYPRVGVTLKISVQPDQEVSLFTDGFPAEYLRQSPESMIGSPLPPINAIRN